MFSRGRSVFCLGILIFFTERFCMQILLLLILFGRITFAGEGKDHSHSMGGELEHAWPLAAVFIGLMLAGFAYSYFTKKK